MNTPITYESLMYIFTILGTMAHLGCYILIHKIQTRTATKIDVARLAICLQLRALSISIIISIFILLILQSI